jgi:hypothetical protein
MKERTPEYLLICNTSDGLIAQLNGVIVQLQFARRQGLKPIVHLHERSHMFGGPNPYFDAAQGDNVWDYYFEPIGPSGRELDELISEGRVVTLSTASELARLHRWVPESFFMNPFGYYRSVENRADGAYPSAWWERQREHARLFFNDGTIRFRPDILAQVDAFQAEKFGAHTLGLQLRGSDKFDFGVGPNLSRKVTPEEYFPHIDRYLAENPDCSRIFVATDQRQWLKVLEAKYPDHAISYSEISLSTSDENMFNATEKKAARGAEVICDMLLLARCRYLFKCHAAVGEMALVMNSGLKFLDLNYAEQPMTAKPTALRPVAAPLVRVLSGLWNALARRGCALERVASLDGSDVMVGSERPRPLNTKTSHGEKAPRAAVFSRRNVSNAFSWVLLRLASVCYRYTPKQG